MTTPAEPAEPTEPAKTATPVKTATPARTVTPGQPLHGTPLVVLNPHASRLHDAETRQALTEALVHAVRERTGVTPRVVAGTMEDAQAAFASAARDRPALVVVAGGDGSVRQAGAALAGSGVPLAIIPAGTGNVLARGLRIGGPAASVRALATATERTLDLGIVRWGPHGQLEAIGEETFVVACGMGLDARIMAGTDRRLKRRFSFGAYVASGLREVLRPRPSRFSLEIDGERYDLTGQAVLIANAGELIPGLLGPRRAIDPGDGRLDVLVLGGRGALGAARGGLELLLRTGDSAGGASLRRTALRVRVDAEPAQPTQIDGDVHDTGWLEAEVVPGALTLLVPAAMD
jgi:diacylglycerol kinase (ATP)